MDRFESTQRLASVFESAIDGIFVIDERGIIDMLNESAAKLFGYHKTDLIGKNISMLMGAEHSAHHDGYITRYLQTGVARIIGIGREVEGLRKNGDRFPFRLSVGEVTLPDRTIFTGIVHDLSAEHAYRDALAELNATLEERVQGRTAELHEALEKLNTEIEERRRAEAIAAESREDALRALERERELGELKSRFVSLASHEFRTPLSTILSSAELLRRYTESEQQERRERHIDRIRKSVLHLTEVLNDFLSLGRMDEGRLEPQASQIHLPTLLQEFVEYIQPTLKPSQYIEINKDLQQEHFESDERFVRNILNNLVSNASKYSGLGAKIALHVKSSTEKGLEIEVRDQGIGIPVEEQAQLFDRFFRARNAATIQGTGLGLHIVARYLQLLGGNIHFSSVEGEGSTFQVQIPAMQFGKGPANTTPFGSTHQPGKSRSRD